MKTEEQIKRPEEEGRYPIVRINNFGPVRKCITHIDRFTVLTGPQASGKSTLAKVVFFCQTVKNDILAQFRVSDNYNIYPVSRKKGIEKRIRGKFLRMFGSTWAMPMDMNVVYEYRKDVSIKIYLEKDRNDQTKNFVEFEFSPLIELFISEKQDMVYQDMDQISHLRTEMEELFGDSYECSYIPAGRGMITLLTDQLNYIFSASDDLISSTIDYCTRVYVENILKIRPIISDGLNGLMEDKLRYTQDKVDKVRLRKLMTLIEAIIKGKYYYYSGEERLKIEGNRYVKINYASSGQQEAVWICNLMFYYLLNNRKVFLIL